MSSQLLRKLQYALKQEGYLICIPTTQFFNPKSERFVKVFHIRHYKKELYKSASIIKIIQYCAGLLEIIQESHKVRNKDKYISEHIIKLEDTINGTNDETEA